MTGALVLEPGFEVAALADAAMPPGLRRRKRALCTPLPAQRAELALRELTQVEVTQKCGRVGRRMRSATSRAGRAAHGSAAAP